MAHATILVPLDGSAIAEEGLASACRLARETGAVLWLMRAVAFSGADIEQGGAERHQIQEATAYLHAKREQLTPQGFSVHTEVLPGEPARAILFACEVHNINLISICTHGYTGLRRVLVGSVAEEVLRRAPTPILLTRAGQGTAESASTPFRRLLVPVDGTPSAEAALAFLGKEHLGRDGEVILFRAVAPVLPPAMPMASEATTRIFEEADQETAQQRAEADTYLATAGNLYLRGWTWKPRSMVGYATQEILAVAKSEQADLIVMATRARHGFDKLVHGSVAGEVVRGAEVPVLLLHGTDVQAQGQGTIPARVRGRGGARE